MWLLENETPYAAERTWTRDVNGMHRWLVAVKATYGIDAAGRLTLLDEQPPVLQLPEYRGEPGASSLRYEADLVPDKVATDILVDGTARVPGGRKVRQLEVSMRVGPVQKRLLVFGTRVFMKGMAGGLSLSSPAEFDERPLIYEWAYGGMDTSNPDTKRHVMDPRNPVGKGVASDPDSLVGKPAHSIEYPGMNPAKVGPAGFGPIASHWTPRLQHAGTYDAAWEARRKPLLPTDFDPRHHSCAPVDQQCAVPLRGGEPVELIHLTRSGTLRFELPRVGLEFETRFGRKAQEHEARLSTVLIEPDLSRVSLVWQTSLPVDETMTDFLDVTFIREGKA